MAYTTIENFKYGLDARRSEFTSQPGTLQMLENGQVNQGGEIDNRLAFVDVGQLATLYDTLGDPGSYGLQDVLINSQPTVAIFGSAFPIGQGPYLNIPTLNKAVPANFTYYQLLHPSLSSGLTVQYNRLKHRVTAIVCSTAFNSVPWVAARFADGNVFIYYCDSTAGLQSPIPSSITGLVLDGLNDNVSINHQIYVELNRLLAPSGYTVVEGPGTKVTLTAPPGTIADYSTQAVSAGGAMTPSKVADSVPGVTAKAPVTFITIVSGAGGATIDNVLVPDPNNLPDGQLDLIAPFSIAYTTSPAKTAGLLAAKINALAVGGYSAAVFNSTSVIIHGPTALGAGANGLNATINYSGTLVLSAAGMPITINTSKASLTVSKRIAKNKSALLQTASVVVSPAGGLAPYGYIWKQVGGDTGIKITTPSKASTAFSATVKQGMTLNAQFVCTVKDSQTVAVTADSDQVDVTIAGLF